MTDATALAAAIAAGRTTALSVMQAALDAAGRHAQLGAIVRIEAESAIAEARKADATLSAKRGPFHGVPFLGKDLGSAAAGLAPAAGAPALRQRMSDPEADSALFARFRGAGLIPFGLTTVPEFGLALTSEPPGLPPARNPWNQAFSPGGSSGGSAAAVAAGIVAISHATDAAGSIRVPAACCGLVGLKASRGAVPGGPDFHNHLMGIASELVLARSVRDVATAFGVATGDVRGPCPQAATRLSGEPHRVALAIPQACGSGSVQAARAAAGALAAAGCEVVATPAPDALGAQAHSLARTVLSVSLAEWLDSFDIGAHEITPISAAVAAEGRALMSTELFAAGRDIARVSHQAWALFDDVDAMLSPVLSGSPPPIGDFDPASTDPEDRFAHLGAHAPNIALANIAGLPALVLPFGLHDDLPVSVQLTGPMGSDAALLDLGARLEAAAPPLEFPSPIAGLP